MIYESSDDKKRINICSLCLDTKIYTALERKDAHSFDKEPNKNPTVRIKERCLLIFNHSFTVSAHRRNPDVLYGLSRRTAVISDGDGHVVPVAG